MTPLMMLSIVAAVVVILAAGMALAWGLCRAAAVEVDDGRAFGGDSEE